MKSRDASRNGHLFATFDDGTRMIAILFWFFLLFAGAIVFFAGEKIERRFFAILLTCVISTYTLNAVMGWTVAQPFVLIVDAGLLAISLIFASRTTRYWPIWFSAFQSIAVATAIAQLIFPNKLPTVYIAVQGFWFLPALASLVLGSVVDSRLGLREITI